MTNTLTNYNFILKLRSITGDFESAKIKHGLLAMGYSVQLVPISNGVAFFNNGVSTRLLQLQYTSKGIDLILPPFSCIDDWELLRDWLLVFFTFHTAVMIAENDLVEDVEAFFDSAKVGIQQTRFENLLNQSMRSDETLHFYGIHRAFYAGIKIFERIREQPDTEKLTYFYALIRKSQYTALNAENCLVEKISEKLSTTFSLLNNQCSTVLQPADMLKIQENTKESFFISYTSIDKLLRHGWIYLDEKQIYIPEMTATEWKNFCHQAREISINTELFSKYVDGDKEDE